jgi:hypothetical protein
LRLRLSLVILNKSQTWIRGRQMKTFLSTNIELKLKLKLKSPLSLLALISLPVLTMTGCNKTATFSLLSDQQQFQQAAAQVNNKIDILWVVDNSGSMAPLQDNLVSNFGNFIAGFQNKGFDYKIAVTTSDAYLSETAFRNDPNRSLYRDGVGTSHSGYPIITPLTPNLIATFVANATQGSQGSGDERVFQSLHDSMHNPKNAGFLRAGSYLAVIILSDEDDFSNDNRAEGADDHDYANLGLWKTDAVIADLDALTGSTPVARQYNVSAITVADDACLQSHLQQTGSTIIGTRYIELAKKTQGVVGSVCDASYASSLNFIQKRIFEAATQFKLSKTPNASTIKVFSDGIAVLQDAQNGWTYNSTENSIIFHGTAVPSANASINVTFDQTSLQ